MKSKAVDTMCLGYNTNRPSKVHYLPPSFRFPPLREGNRERRAYSVPPASRGNLKEGVTNCCFFVNFGLAIGISRSSASFSQGFEALSALRRDSTS